jgi:hypothetical protein
MRTIRATGGEFIGNACYLLLDLRHGGSIEVGSPKTETVPSCVTLGHAKRFPIRALTADEANALLDRAAPLAEEARLGYREAMKFDRYGRPVATFDHRGLSALDGIREVCASA